MSAEYIKYVVLFVTIIVCMCVHTEVFSIKSIIIILIILFLFLFIINIYPNLVISIFELYESKITWRIKTNKSIAALTIDDIPMGSATQIKEIISILDEYNSKATFFMLSGEFEKASNEVKKIIRDSVSRGVIELANHGEFDEDASSLNKKEFIEKHNKCDKLISCIKPEPKYKFFRPGKGHVTKQMLEWCNSNNYICVLGNIFPNEFSFLSFTNAIYLRYVVSNGSIIILHDHKKTPSNLRNFFSKRKNKEIDITKLSELFDVKLDKYKQFSYI